MNKNTRIFFIYITKFPRLPVITPLLSTNLYRPQCQSFVLMITQQRVIKYPIN